MSDIVERLRAASHDETLSCGALYAEAGDEIERLLIQQRLLLQSLGERNEEIERLRQELARDENQWRKDWHILAGKIEEKDEEIERLRELAYSYPPTKFAPDGCTWKQETKNLQGETLEQAAEIERLNNLVHLCLEEKAGVFKEIELMRKEVTRLHDIEQRMKSADNDATKFAIQASDQRKKIEQQANLLRDFLAAHDSYEIHKRVREALGDE
jgi:GrpB-like predicted nucleotidyltransferase (UPF0157 family)